jgi:hypothetical protein
LKLSTVAGALVAATVFAGCGTRPPSSKPFTLTTKPCTTDADCGSTGDCRESACVPYAVCPADIQPTFSSINENVFAMSCAISTGCHTADGASSATGLDLQTDPYTTLLGADGKGAPAANIDGSVRHLVRVVPGDPDNSYLVIKLTTKTNQDPQYGSGMPRTAPGSVCPPTVAAVRSWIQAGATND